MKPASEKFQPPGIANNRLYEVNTKGVYLLAAVSLLIMLK
jgi:hypothetical protein